MANFPCPKCHANNPSSGWCVVCQTSLGTIKKAISNAAGATIVLGFLWVLMAVSTGMQLTIFAALFGAVVAACTSHFSGGRGFIYQAIATTFTFVGIIFFDTLAVIAVMLRTSAIEASQITLTYIWDHSIYNALNDPATTLFYIAGIMGSFIIWR